MKQPDHHQPPQIPLRFFRWYCHPDYQEDIEGDLRERFERRVVEKGIKKARWEFGKDVIRLFRPGIIRSWSMSYQSNHYNMFKNYFKIGWRNLSKHTLYSSIKIGGLAMGIAACLLILLYVRDELSYDQQYPEADRIYRPFRILNLPGETLKNASFPAPLASTLTEQFPEVEAAGRILTSELFGAGSKQVRRADRAENMYEEGFAYADQEWLDILQPKFVYGDRSHALDKPHTIILSKSKADKFFPEDDPLGKTLILDNDETEPYTIGGVFEDFSTKSHLPFDFYMTLTGREFGEGEQTNWYQSNYYTYLKVKPGSDVEKLESKISESIVNHYILPTMQEAGQADAEDFAKRLSIHLQPVKDIHLHSAGIRDRLNHGDIRFVWLFGTIAGFILVIACINFINLSTAKSANRAKEVGLRKVVGSFRKQLIHQFLTESILFSLLSFGLALILAFLLLPYFNELASKSLTLSWREWWLFPLLGVGAIMIGILAGLYPAFYLSRFKPAQVLKGGLSWGGRRSGSKSSKLRSTLVIFQFITSMVLIVGTIIIYQQMQFILHKDVGFEKEQVLMIQGAHTLDKQLPAFKNELLKLSDVKQVSVSDYLPLEGTKRNSNTFWKEGKVEQDPPVSGQIWRVDHDYIKTLGMNMVEGRDFNVEMASDSQAVVINERMAQELGLENPIGERITNGGTVWQIIGVVQDFNFQSFKEAIRPLCLVIGNSPSVVSVKVNTDDMHALTEAVTAVWKQFLPHQAIRFAFLDESFARMYSDVQRMARIFTSFAVLAIFIACLGLFAMSAFMVEQRRKEISIRLVLGASLSQVFRLLTQNYLALVLISLVIAAPIAWYLMQRWLEDYEYRIQISWDVFLIAGLIVTFISILTVSYQSIRACLVDPVNNLRSE